MPNPHLHNAGEEEDRTRDLSIKSLKADGLLSYPRGMWESRGAVIGGWILPISYLAIGVLPVYKYLLDIMYHQGWVGPVVIICCSLSLLVLVAPLVVFGSEIGKEIGRTIDHSHK